MREFRQEKGRTSAPQVWRIERKGNAVRVEWGQLDGAMQTTQQQFSGVNVGKANEESPEQAAQNWMDRQILLRQRKGYREVGVDGGYLTETTIQAEGETIVHGDEVSFIQLPRNLRFYKPKNSMTPYMEKLAANGEAWFIEKRNGNMCVVVIGEDNYARMYSSSMAISHQKENIPWMDRFPQIERALAGTPAKTILLCELVAGERKDDLDRVGEVLRSLTPRAFEVQKKGALWLCVWDVAYYNGEMLLGVEPISERLDRAEAIVEGVEYLCRPLVYAKESLIPMKDGKMESFDGSIDMAIQSAKAQGLEGWVVVDPQATYGDRALSFHGKPDRPKECCKLKPKWEADFILRWDPDNGIGTRGKGKKSVGVGAFFAYLLDEKGEEVFVSKVGGGLTEGDVLNYAIPGTCFVGEVEFTSITKDGSLQFPEFVRERMDKTTDECTLSQLDDIKRRIGSAEEDTE